MPTLCSVKLVILVILLVPACNCGSSSGGTDGSTGTTGSGANSSQVDINSPWIKTPSTAPNASVFKRLKTDSNGNSYAVGTQKGTGSYTYSSGVSTSGGSSDTNVVLVKYNAYGTAAWAKSVSVSASDISQFLAVTVDNAGNVYAAGFQCDGATYTYGTGVTATGVATGLNTCNAMLVKYDSAGNAQWARTATSGSMQSTFLSVLVDNSNNVIVSGRQWGNGTNTYAPGITLTTTTANAIPFLLKLDTSGSVQWISSITAGTSGTALNALASDAAGNIFAVGTHSGTGTNTYAPGVTITGPHSSSSSILLKFNSSGTAQWARTLTAAPSSSAFNAVVLDGSGNIFISGKQSNSGTYTYATGVSATGAYSTGDNAVIVKYDSTGTAQWVSTPTGGSGDSVFNDIALDSAGNIYACGYQRGSSTFTYAPTVTATASSIFLNYLLVKFDGAGIAQFARTVSGGTSASECAGVGLSSTDHIYSAGYQQGTSTYTYGNVMSASGAGANQNAMILKFVN